MIAKSYYLFFLEMYLEISFHFKRSYIVLFCSAPDSASGLQVVAPAMTMMN